VHAGLNTFNFWLLATLAMLSEDGAWSRARPALTIASNARSYILFFAVEVAVQFGVEVAQALFLLTPDGACEAF